MSLVNYDEYEKSYQFPHVLCGWISYVSPYVIVIINYALFISLAHTYIKNKTTLYKKLATEVSPTIILKVV